MGALRLLRFTRYVANQGIAMKINSDQAGCEIVAGPGESINDCDPREIVSLVRRHGWLVFDGFDATVAEFEALTSRFGTCAGTRTVHYPAGGEALGFHAEDAYNPYRPDAIWFLCVFAGSDGGAPTRIVDGVRLLGDLGADWQEFCRANVLRFDRQWSRELWQAGVGPQGKAELDAVLRGIPAVSHQFLRNGDLHVSYSTPIVTRTPAGEDSFSNTMLQAITEPPFYGLSLGNGAPVPPELAETVQQMAIDREIRLGWKAGRAGVLDNFRMMHRRSEYNGTGRDLRARHCEDFFGSVLPDASTPVSAWAKSLLQGDEGYPVQVGPLDRETALTTSERA